MVGFMGFTLAMSLGAKASLSVSSLVFATLVGLSVSNIAYVVVGFVDEVVDQSVGSNGADLLDELLFDELGSKFHGGFTSLSSLMSSNTSRFVVG